MNTRHRTQGFTLIEIMVAIAILGVLSSLLITQYLRAQKKPYDAAAQTCGQAIVRAMNVYRGIHDGLPSMPFNPNALGGEVREMCQENGAFRIAGYSSPGSIQVDKYAIESSDGRGGIAFFVNSPRGSGFWVYHLGDTYCGAGGCTLNKLIPFGAYGL